MILNGKLLFILLFFYPAFIHAGLDTRIDSLQEALSHTEGALRADILNELAESYQKINPEECRKLALEAYEIADRLRYEQGCGRSWYNLARHFELRSEYDSALTAYHKSVQHYAETDEKEIHSRAYSAIGLLLMSREQYPDALDNLVKALVIRQETGDSVSIGVGYLNIGIVMEYLNEKKQALEYYENALRYFKNGESRYYLAKVLRHIGLLYYNMGKFNEALDYFSRSKQSQKAVNDDHGMAELYINLGNLYGKLENNKKALHYLQLALRKGEQIEDTLMISKSLIALGKMHTKLKDYNMALEDLKKGLKLARKINDREWIKNASQGLADCYANMGMNEKAYHTFKSFSELRDSLLHEFSKGEITKIKAVLEIERNKNSRLKTELKEAVLHAQTVKKNALIIGLIILLALFLVLYYFYGKKKEL